MDLPPPGSPVEDDLKPDLPYVVGARLRIQECQPHQPFGISFRDEASRTYHWNPMLKWESASEFCIQNPPLEGQPIANPTRLTIIIDSKLACGHDRGGAQLVKCHDEDTGASFVAKIYDPLYYPWPSNLDATHEVDEHFTTEATVYMTLRDMHKDNTSGNPRVQDHLKGSIPQYYGSYTWQTQLLDGRRRDVRLILMEYLPFPSMWAIIKKNKVEKIPADTRMRLLARAFELDSWLSHYGIHQNDFAARNILVDPDQGRVILLDFGIANIRDLYNSEWVTYRDKPLPALPKSPIEIFGCNWGDEMECWVPKEFRTVRARYDWFMNVWGNSEEFRPLGGLWRHHHSRNVKRALAEEEQENQEKRKKMSLDEPGSQTGEGLCDEW